MEGRRLEDYRVHIIEREALTPKASYYLTHCNTVHLVAAPRKGGNREISTYQSTKLALHLRDDRAHWVTRTASVTMLG